MRPTRGALRDVAIALVLVTIGVTGTRRIDAEPGASVRMDWLGYALIVIAAAVLVVRRRWPLPVLAVATAAATTYLLIGYPYGPILASFLVAVYTVARHKPTRVSVPAAGIALLVLLSHVLRHEDALPGFRSLIPAGAWVIVPLTVGIAVRATRTAAELARADAIRQHVGDERLRVAQEVHDVVGHGLAAIKMQADVALHLLTRQPEQAERALTAISDTSADALDELRSTLAVVRTAGAPADAVGNDRGLDRLDELCGRMRSAGIDVRLETTGPPRPLSRAAGLAGYRVVQESLTNVLRHGSAKVASVRVAYETDAVTLMISNPAAGARAPQPAAERTDGHGLGIPGMQRRVKAVGGRFSAGPAGDRFEVRATIPTGPAGQTTDERQT
jgi:signal transduction histidine kinase